MITVVDTYGEPGLGEVAPGTRPPSDASAAEGAAGSDKLGAALGPPDPAAGSSASLSAASSPGRSHAYGQQPRRALKAGTCTGALFLVHVPNTGVAPPVSDRLAGGVIGDVAFAGPHPSFVSINFTVAASPWSDGTVRGTSNPPAQAAPWMLPTLNSPAAVVRGQYYAFGGALVAGASFVVYRYDPATTAWATASASGSTPVRL
eukprot:tig00000189_g14315.t1